MGGLTQTATSGAGVPGAWSEGAWSFAVRSLKFVKSRLNSPTLDKFILACCLCSADGAGKGNKLDTRRLFHCSTPKTLTILLCLSCGRLDFILLEINTELPLRDRPWLWWVPARENGHPPHRRQGRSRGAALH